MKAGTQRPKGKDGLHTRAQMICSMKVRHVSERIADRAADIHTERTGVAMYSYRCSECKGWHLTKRKQR